MMRRIILSIVIAIGLSVILWLNIIYQRYIFPKPEPSLVKVSKMLSTEHVQNGDAIYKKLSSGLKNNRPILVGFGAPSVALVVPEKAWGRLSKAEQIDVTFYAESLISRVRESPYEFVDMPSSAPVYKSAIEYAQNICDDCWEVILGNPKNGVLSLDTTIVQGDSAWDRDTTPDRGEKASTFRGQ
jgi:hypothetical protein